MGSITQIYHNSVLHIRLKTQDSVHMHTESYNLSYYGTGWATCKTYMLVICTV